MGPAGRKAAPDLTLARVPAPGATLRCQVCRAEAEEEGAQERRKCGLGSHTG